MFKIKLMYIFINLENEMIIFIKVQCQMINVNQFQ